jgi:4-carboxymuconolactone decarboxylase
MTQTNANRQPHATSSPHIAAVSPALDRYISQMLFGEVWQRPNLSARDRGLATLAVLISRSQWPALLTYTNHVLDNGVTPAELSEAITHLAFYCGFPNAVAAAGAVEPLFKERGIDAGQLHGTSPTLEPFDEAAEAAREAQVRGNFGAVTEGVVEYTDRLFKEVWRRPGLSPRDRSLITVSALLASGHTAQLTYHLNRGMDNGLTRAEIGEWLTHLAFYAGWPSIFSALPVVKDIFEQRPA